MPRRLAGIAWGAAKALTSVEWDADIPPGTRLELRSRTGGEVVENVHYFDKKGKEITERRCVVCMPSGVGWYYPVELTEL